MSRAALVSLVAALPALCCSARDRAWRNRRATRSRCARSFASTARMVGAPPGDPRLFLVEHRV
jgi:hypothetical protein